MKDEKTADKALIAITIVVSVISMIVLVILFGTSCVKSINIGQQWGDEVEKDDDYYAITSAIEEQYGDMVDFEVTYAAVNHSAGMYCFYVNFKDKESINDDNRLDVYLGIKKIFADYMKKNPTSKLSDKENLSLHLNFDDLMFINDGLSFSDSERDFSFLINDLSKMSDINIMNMTLNREYSNFDESKFKVLTELKYLSISSENEETLMKFQDVGEYLLEDCCIEFSILYKDENGDIRHKQISLDE